MFPALVGKPVVVEFTAPEASSDSGWLLLREADRRLALAAVDSCVDGLPDTYIPVRTICRDDGAHLYCEFQWQERTKGVLLPNRIRVAIDAFKARAARLSRVVYPITAPLEPQVTPEDAIRTALEAARPYLEEGETLAMPEAVLEVDFGSGADIHRRFLTWSVQVYTQPPASRPVVWAMVDAISGGMVDFRIASGDRKPDVARPPGTEGPQGSVGPSATRLWVDRRLRAGALAVAALVVGALLLPARRSRWSSRPSARPTTSSTGSSTSSTV